MSYEKEIRIRFYEELNDFIPLDLRKKEFTHIFTGNPSVKDIIEAIGIPHPEADLILVNGNSVNFNYKVQDKDRISVYPVFELLDISQATHLRKEPLRDPKFILDINLGKLARKLRMLGFDSLYENNYIDDNLVENSHDQNRIILTRDIGLLKHKLVSRGYWVRSTEPEKQLSEVIKKFDLFSKFKPFSICMACNGGINPVDKEKILNNLPPKTKLNFDEFYECANCRKIYWKGSHYQNMLKSIQSIKNSY